MAAIAIVAGMDVNIITIISELCYPARRLMAKWKNLREQKVILERCQHHLV